MCGSSLSHEGCTVPNVESQCFTHNIELGPPACLVDLLTTTLSYTSVVSYFRVSMKFIICYIL